MNTGSLAESLETYRFCSARLLQSKQLESLCHGGCLIIVFVVESTRPQKAWPCGLEAWYMYSTLTGKPIWVSADVLGSRGPDSDSVSEILLGICVAVSKTLQEVEVFWAYNSVFAASHGSVTYFWATFYLHAEISFLVLSSVLVNFTCSVEEASMRRYCIG